MKPLSRRAFIASSLAATAVPLAPSVTRATARPFDWNKIVRVAIHPAIGIARVGNSPDAFYFAPEVPATTPVGPVKDAQGFMAKQAARFRIYGFDAQGNVVREITEGMAKITWSTRVGNAKAAWYGADEPLDLPNARPVPLRNAQVSNRSDLAILSDEVMIRGNSEEPRSLSGGYFGDRAVNLGEVLTDSKGRLIVMPGSGSAVSLPGAPPLSGFADNDGWSDTTADGPVRATVDLQGRTLECDPAWVVCASPNFGAGIAAGLTTLYDTVFAGLVVSGRRKRRRTEFNRDIAPIFQRIVDMQWVNKGYLTTNGFGSLRDWTSTEWQEQLRDGSEENKRVRQTIFAMFRDPFYGTTQPGLEPHMYGDMVQIPADRDDPRQWLAISPVQHAHLRSWADGNFTIANHAKPRRLKDVPLAQRPASLDRAAMDSCLGGAFHPGVEFPWLARVPRLWTDDLRLRAFANEPNLDDYGTRLTPAVAIAKDGPLASIGPGDIIKWMGVPWQADSASCRFGYQRPVSAVLPTFWAARIPNSVLSTSDYRIVMDRSRSLEERQDAFRKRVLWQRHVMPPVKDDGLALMVRDWFRLGVVRERPGPTDIEMPERMLVEWKSELDGPYEIPEWASINAGSRFPVLTVSNTGTGIVSIGSDKDVAKVSLEVKLGRPAGISVDAMGVVYIADTTTGTIVKVPVGASGETWIGNLQHVEGIACDARGNVYACGGASNGWLSVIAPDGSWETLLESRDGLASPRALAMAPDGALLVANSDRILRYDPLLRKVLDAEWINGLASPANMAWDADGSLFVVEQEADAVRKFDDHGRPLPFVLSGDPLPSSPYGIAFDGINSMLISGGVNGSGRISNIQIQGGKGEVSDWISDGTGVSGLVMRGRITPVPLV